MIAYLLKSTACMLLLLLVYHLFLEREKMHLFNRYFLLFSLIFSHAIPLVTINTGTPAPLSRHIDEINSRLNTQAPATTKSLPLSPPDKNISKLKPDSSTPIIPLLVGLYLLVSSILAMRLLHSVYTLCSRIRKNPHASWQQATLVLMDDGGMPHSFFRYIFVDKQLYDSDNINETIFTHELTHARQWHSADIIFIELLKIIFWFNPVLYFYKRAIQTNHEYLADESVVAAIKNVAAYQRLLLKVQSGEPNLELTSSIQFSLTKKRIIMMTKKSTRRHTLCKQWALIPVLAVLVFAFSTQTTTAQDVHQMSLSELIDAVYDRMDALESLSEKDQAKLQKLMSKMHHKLQPDAPAPPTPAKARPDNPPSPPIPEPPVTISAKNILSILINSYGSILMDEEPTRVHEVKEKAKKFVTNNGADPKSSDSPQKAYISIKITPQTSFGDYTDVLTQIREAYREIKNDAANANFNVNYNDLEENGSGKRKIDKMYPERISYNSPNAPNTKPQPPVKKDTTKLNEISKEYRKLINTYIKIKPIKENQKQMEAINNNLHTLYDRWSKTFEKETGRKLVPPPQAATIRMKKYYRNHL